MRLLTTAVRDIQEIYIWIRSVNKNASRVIAVLKDFGFGSLGITEQDLLKENYVTQLGYPPLRIDILNNISGVGFDEPIKQGQRKNRKP